jgi:DNA-binding XRE family transcriptional regulator/SOS-response transcriptional repressor LexA
MREMGLTQKGLAIKAGLNETAIRDILKGRSKDPQFSTLRAIARIFGCPVEDLYAAAMPKAYGLSDRKGNPWPADVGAEAREVAQDDTPEGGSFYVEEIDILSGESAAALTDGRSRRVLASWQLPPDLLSGKGSGAAGNFKIVHVHGDSMAPDFLPGDRVLVNLSDATPSPAGLFLLWDGAGFILRRCEVRPNTRPLRLILRAHNPDYSAHEVALKDVTVCGRVVGRWQKV